MCLILTAWCLKLQNNYFWVLPGRLIQTLLCTCLRCENVPKCDDLLPKSAHVGSCGSLSKHLTSGGSHSIVESRGLAKWCCGTKCWRAAEGRWTPKHRSAAEAACEETTAFCLIFEVSTIANCSAQTPVKMVVLHVVWSWVHIVQTHFPFKNKTAFIKSARLSGGKQQIMLTLEPTLSTGLRSKRGREETMHWNYSQTTSVQR